MAEETGNPAGGAAASSTGATSTETTTTTTPPAAAATTTADNAGTRTIVDTAAAGGAERSAPQTFPDNWKDQMAGDDKGLRNILDRYASPSAFAAAHRQLTTRISSGELRAGAPPSGATPEQQAAWRKDNGIPDAPEGYLATLPKTLTLGEGDKAAVGDFLKTMHTANVPPATVNASIEWYYKNLENVQAERVKADDLARVATEDAMRAEWGNENFRKNINIMDGFMSTAPAGVKEAVFYGRGPDGTPLMSNPSVVRWLLASALEINPASTVVPGSSAGSAASMADRKAEIQKLMGDRSSDYWRGPKANGMQAEYRSIIEAEQKLAARSRG